MRIVGASKFPFQNGSIKSHFEDGKIAYERMFPFQNGSIKSVCYTCRL